MATKYIFCEVKNFMSNKKLFGNARAILASLNADKIAELTRGGQTLTGALENLDPTYDAVGMEQHFDAFERLLLVAGFVPRSSDTRAASTIEDIETRFGRADETESVVSRALVTEVIRRAYRKASFEETRAAGIQLSGDAVLGSFINQYSFPSSVNLPTLEPAIKMSELVARTEGITTDVARPFYLLDIDEDEETQARIAEGAEIPAIEITNDERIIRLKKTGIRVDATYESLRRTPIDSIAYAFQRIGIRADARKVDKIINVLLNGDGNPNTSATNHTLTSLGGVVLNGLDLRSYLAWKKKFKNPFMLTHVFGQEDNTLDLELLDTGSANIPLMMAGAPFNQQFVPMNDRLRDAVRVGDIDSVPSNLLLGIDGRVAVKRWFEIGAEIREVDKWIREQKESFVMSEVEGYQVDEPLAVKTLQLDA
jgi:hypothetical protein